MKRKTQKIISVFLAALITFSVLAAIPVSAEDTQTDNPPYVTLLYSVSDNGATITGYDYHSDGDWNDDKIEITVPDTIGDNHPVTAIGENAFRDLLPLTRITLPETVTSIGDYAFYACDKLDYVNIPDGVTSIGDYAFYHCKNLNYVNIPDGVTSIGEGTFMWSNLTNIDIPDSVTVIGKNAFYECDNLKNIKIPETVTSIGDSAFYQCKGFTDIKIPDSVTQLGECAFMNCFNIESLTIGNGVTELKDRAFYECRNLKSLKIGKSVKIIGTDAFRLCSGLENVTIPNNVRIIDYSSFSACMNLSTVKIGSGVETINSAFADCENLSAVIIPDSVVYMNEFTFKNCNKLTIYGGFESYAESYANENGIPFEYSYIRPDDTGIMVIYDKAYSDFSVKELTDNEDISKATAALGSNMHLISLYDICITVQGETVHQPEGIVIVKIPTENKNASVYRIEADGSKTDMNAVYMDGYMVFTANHFSVYALAVEDGMQLLQGDANGDGEVSILDATHIQKYLTGLVDDNDILFSVSDVNGDGEVSILDATYIQKQLTGLI